MLAVLCLSRHFFLAADTALTKRFDITAVTSQLGELVVYGLLLVENFLEQIDGALIIQQLRPFVEATIGCDFVMFHLLRGGDQGRIDGW